MRGKYLILAMSEKNVKESMTQQGGEQCILVMTEKYFKNNMRGNSGRRMAGNDLFPVKTFYSQGKLEKKEKKLKRSTRWI